MDDSVKQQAERPFGEFGMNMSTAININIFVRQAIRQNKIPFEISADVPTEPKPVRPPFPFGCMKGRVWIADDFNEPLDDFKEYME